MSEHLTPPPAPVVGLKRQVVGGLFWATLAQLAGRLLTTLTQLILLKLLSPSAIGLVGMAMLTINAFQFLQDFGFASALIYRRKDVQEAADTAFVTVIASSLAIFGIAFGASPLVARFFRQEDVTPILRALSVTFLISGVGNVPYTLLGRELNFRRRIIPDLTAQIIGSAAAIWLAFQGFGAWALVWRELIRTALATALVWVVSTYRPRLRFNLAIARELFDYGRHIVASQSLIFLITNVDNAVVGRYAGDTALGHYQTAYNLSNLPATQVTNVISQVMFPTFSKLADGDPAQLGQIRARYYLTTMRYITWLTAPIAVAIILYASAFFLGIYGQTWAPAVLPLQLLAVYGLIRSVAANMGSIFRGLGKPQWLTYIAAWRLITMLALLYPVTQRWGITGVAALSVLVAIVDFIISATLVDRLVTVGWRVYAQTLIPTGLASLGAGLLSLVLYNALPRLKVSSKLLIAGAGMALLYALLVWLLDRRFRAATRMIAGQACRLWTARFGAPAATPAPPAE